MKILNAEYRVTNIYKSGGVKFNPPSCNSLNFKRVPVRTFVQKIAFLVSILLLSPLFLSCSEEEPQSLSETFTGEISDWEEESGRLTENEE